MTHRMMRQMPRRLLWILLVAPSEPIELLVGSISFFWGAWLLCPQMDSFTSTPLYQKLGRIAPEWVWGLYLLTLGGSRVVLTITQNIRGRRAVALLGSATWIAMTCLFASADIRSPGSVTYGMLALASLWVFVRLRTLA